MLGAELRARQSKLEREQREQQRRAREKEERAQRVHALAEERRRQEEAEREERLQRERERREEEEARRDAIQEHNRGVYWEDRLVPVALDEAAVAARGIRRFRDKIRLPASAGDDLMGQSAPERNGPMFFEVAVPGTSLRALAGLLEFMAAPGTVELPSAVQRSLWGDADRSGIDSGRVTVRYLRLEKATFAQLQPVSAGFARDCQDVRATLEGALVAHATLGDGQRLSVPVATPSGEVVDHEVRVVRVEPNGGASITDTDVAVDILPSLEHEEAERRREEEEAAIRAELERVRLQAIAEEEERRREEEEERKRGEREEEARRQCMEEARSLLPPEPSGAEAEAGVLTCRLRFPDGAVRTRRFALHEPLRHLFVFADAHMGRPGTYNLARQFPRRVVANLDVTSVGAGGGAGAGAGAGAGVGAGGFGKEGGVSTRAWVYGSGGPSLEEAGFVAGSEALLVEPLRSRGDGDGGTAAAAQGGV